MALDFAERSKERDWDSIRSQWVCLWAGNLFRKKLGKVVVLFTAGSEQLQGVAAIPAKDTALTIPKRATEWEEAMVYGFLKDHGWAFTL